MNGFNRGNTGKVVMVKGPGKTRSKGVKLDKFRFKRKKRQKLVY